MNSQNQTVQFMFVKDTWHVCFCALQRNLSSNLKIVSLSFTILTLQKGFSEMLLSASSESGHRARMQAVRLYPCSRPATFDVRALHSSSAFILRCNYPPSPLSAHQNLLTLPKSPPQHQLLGVSGNENRACNIAYLLHGLHRRPKFKFSGTVDKYVELTSLQ